MIKKKRLGQHFLNSDTIARDIATNAKISKHDAVFEVGTGYGILTALLCDMAREVISVDIDKRLIDDARIKFAHIENLTLECGDGFTGTRNFTVFVSNLPYSQSRAAIEWLSQQDFVRGTIMIQDEFAKKLAVPTSRAVSVIANYCFEMSTCMHVSSNNFLPPPKVDSVVICIRQKRRLGISMIKAINHIFAYRRKTVKNIMRQFGISSDMQCRIDNLSVEEIIDIARQIVK